MSLDPYIVVATPYGRIQGKRMQGVAHFGRVPYALPPTGEHRFALPRPLPETLDAGIDATGIAPIPPQFPSRLGKVMGDYPAPQDEHCLHLDMWVPEERDALAPVFAFIHGGAFMTGGGSTPCYDGSVLARRTGMVVINISYRLGALGFQPIAGVGPANLGLHDQIAALRWVRRAIGAFGGDPANVTLSGQSAGGLSINLMQCLPYGRELFDRAIPMSSPLGIDLPSLDEQHAQAHEFLAALGLPASREALVKASVGQILQAQLALLKRPPPAGGPIGSVTPPFMPCMDGDLIPTQPLALARQGKAAWCPTMIGTTREENAAFYIDSPLSQLPLEALRGEYARRYGAQADALLAKAIARRAPGSPLAVLTDLGTSEVFGTAALHFAAEQQRHGNPAYVYRFDWQSPRADIAACHCLDLPFLFGNLDTWQAAPMMAGADRAETTHLSHLFQDACAAFARTGSPNGPALPDWPRHDARRAMMHFDRLTEATGVL